MLKNKLLLVLISSMALLFSCTKDNNDSRFLNDHQDALYAPVPSGVETRWISPENPTGEKAMGGKTNKGAKGNAFYIIQPGETKVLMDVKGSGIIQRIWMSGTVGRRKVPRRAVRIDMYWDGKKKPAVSAPIGDFFGTAHGLLVPFESKLFLSPEGRSVNSNVKMPYKKSALITITNESDSEFWLWYDINFLKVDKLPENILYFHTYWSRNLNTTLGQDFTILPQVNGSGRYIGTNIGVIGNEDYQGTWFGEGEVKIFLDGDKEFPSLVGTGTEDYIGSGWGQGEFSNQYVGSLISSREHDIYAFYRYHLEDDVFFHEDCKVTIQQMGSSNKRDLIEMMEKGADVKPVWFLDKRDSITKQGRLLEPGNEDLFNSPDFPITSTNYYRSDDVCATAYFYLDKPQSNLPELPPLELRMKHLKERVWDNLD
ncbi:MAG TPA: glycoside hydrolase family 172 protein [Bacteroidales bacterium]|nr:glycoside hydrolase family 172 protein [Bacteroidales bacterium]